jgi:amino acid transporter
MQGLIHIAPATGLLFTIQFTTSQAGIVAPLAYLAAFPIVLVLGVCLIQMARHLPSAGGCDTYISRTVDPRGFWLRSARDLSAARDTRAFLRRLQLTPALGPTPV